MRFIALLLIVTVDTLVWAEDSPRRFKNQHNRKEHADLNNDSSQRSARQHRPSHSKQVAQPDGSEPLYQYRPYSAIPAHIKQLLADAYPPQVPYVNPHAFFYGINGILPSPGITQKNGAQSNVHQSQTEFLEKNPLERHSTYINSNRISQGKSEIIYRDEQRNYKPRYNSRIYQNRQRDP